MDHLMFLNAPYFAQRYIFVFVFGVCNIIQNTNLKWLFPYLKEIFVFCVNKEMTKPTLYVYLKLVRKDRVYKEDKIFACSLQAVSQREEEK